MACDPLIQAPDDAALSRAAELLRAGGLIGMPTETVYGLACNALDVRAVARVFEAKARPSFDPLIVHLAEAQAVERIVAEVPGVARRLMEAFWPGPLTLVMRKREVVPDLVTSGLATVAVRVPGHDVARALIARAGVPVAAPSANRFGGVSPTRAEHVVSELGDKVDLVLDGGPCVTGVESTVVSVLPGGPTVLRLGGTTVEAIMSVVGEVHIATGEMAAASGASGGGAAQQGRASPGMLERHYAPATPLLLVDSGVEPTPAKDEALLCFTGTQRAADWGVVETLAPDASLPTAAANLFAALRRLDAAGVKRIWAQRVPNEGLGRAINDRLRRASLRD